MDMLIFAIILIGKILIAAIALIASALAARFVWAAWIRANVKHDPIEYYRGWDGYSHPISLQDNMRQQR
jgi:hypothetical protein